MKQLQPARRVRSRALLFALLAAPSLSVAAPSTVTAAACGATYLVRPGDSLWSISAACAVSIATLRRLNRFGAVLQPGQAVQIADPYAPHTYVVRPGDTLEAIAARLGIAPSTLVAGNGLADPNTLRVGQLLRWRLADVRTSATGTAASALAAPASASATPATTGAPISSATVTYRVKPGDSLWSISLAQHVSVAALVRANGIADARMLRVGAVLRIPTSTSAPTAGGTAAPATTTIVNTGVYRVKPGDSFWAIASTLGLTPQALAQANGLTLASPLHPGQALRYAVTVYTGPSLAQVGALLDQQAAQVGVEDALLRAIAWRESSWRMVDATDGGIGVMQLMPDTVTWLKATYLPGAWDPHNVTDNIHAGAVLLQVYSRLYAGDIAKIAMAYHGGMGAVTAHPPAEMRRYVAAVGLFHQAFLNGVFPE